MTAADRDAAIMAAFDIELPAPRSRTDSDWFIAYLIQQTGSAQEKVAEYAANVRLIAERTVHAAADPAKTLNGLGVLQNTGVGLDHWVAILTERREVLGTAWAALRRHVTA